MPHDTEEAIEPVAPSDPPPQAGGSPTSPDFGATVFESKKGSEGGSFPLGAAHSEYFREGNSSLEYMGEVIAGQNKGD